MVTRQRSAPAAAGFADACGRLADAVESVICGKRDVIDLVIAALLADGHVLLEDIPGVGKTSMAKALAAAIDGDFGRVQFTPDLLPTDVSGVSIFHRGRDEFEFRPGPVFANILLADEINRASPKTQSALLEAMAERQVTVDGTTYGLAAPFLVIATQNPIEHEGTFPLPDSQLDRFLMRIDVGYPDPEAELAMLETHGTSDPLQSIRPVLGIEDIMELRATANAVHVAPTLKQYLVQVATGTRSHPQLELGMSPRATLSMLRVTRVWAAMNGKDYVTPDDVKALADPVLSHRLLLTPEADLQGIPASAILADVLDTVPYPGLDPPDVRPTRQGLLVLLGAAGLVALGRVFGLEELYAIGAAVALLVLICGFWVALRDVDVVVARSVRPSRVHVGNPCTVELQIRNRARRPTPVLRVRDPVTGTAGADLLLSPVGLRKTSKVAYRLPTTRRGLLTVGPMSVEIADPFGLASSRSNAAPAVEITVLPRIDDIPPLPRTVGPDPDGGAETGSLGRVGEDFAALRSYVIGDDLRRVHWPSSACSEDDLLVRQDDVPWQGRICVVLDLRRECHDTETIERAVSAAASIVRAHLRRGDHVRLVSTAGVDSGYGVGASHLDGVLEYLAVADRSTRGSLHAALDVAERSGSGALVVVTGRPSMADIDAVESLGVAVTARRIVRFDATQRAMTGRRTQVLGIAPGTSFADVWQESSPPAGRTSRSSRSARSRHRARRAATP